MAIQKTEAFILRSYPFRTSSLIVVAFSRSFGKIKAVAKGVRKEGVLSPGTFEPFSLIEMVFYEKIRSELHLLSEASLLESHEPLRSNLVALASAYYISELVDQMTEPHDPHEALFDLLHFVFEKLPFVSPSTVVRLFEMRLLQEVGLPPHLENCLACGASELGKIYFSVRQGGIVCERCKKRFQDAQSLNEGTLEEMRYLSRNHPEAYLEESESRSKGKTGEEIDKVMQRFLTERLGKRLPTRKFLEQATALTH